MLMKPDFVRYLTTKGYNTKESKIIVNDVFDCIKELLANGEALYLYGFGTFELVQHRKKDKKTGERILYYEPTFIPGSGFTKQIDANFPPTVMK